MAVIELEDGTRIEVEDAFLSLPEDEQQSLLRQATGAQPPPDSQQETTFDQGGEPTDEGPGFFERVGARLEGRGEQFNEIVNAFAPDDQGVAKTIFETLGEISSLGVKRPKGRPGVAESAFQGVGVVAGGALDIIGEGVSAAAGGAFDILQTFDRAFVPGDLRASRDEQVKAVWGEVVGNDKVQAAVAAAGQGFEAYKQWAEKNPREARNLEAAANIGLVLAPVKGKPAGAPAPQTIVGRAGERVGAAATRQTVETRASFIDDLVRPKTTKKVREAEILRTSEGAGLTGGRTVTPAASEKAIADVVTTIPGVTKKNTDLKNLQVIQKENVREAASLATKLEQSTVKIPRTDIRSAMDDVVLKLKDNPLLVGDAAKTGERVVAQANKFLSAEKNTPAGVLRARKQFDAWVKNQKPKIFDPQTESALSIAVREPRQAMNDIIERAVPTLGVKKSLSRQSKMFDAIDNIGPKAADEAATKIGRLAQNVSRATGLDKGLRESITKLTIGGAAIGGLGFSGGIGPAVTAGVALAAGVSAKRALTSAQAKKAVSALLSQADKAIRVAKQRNLTADLQRLRADRAAVVEVLRNMREATRER